MSFIDMAYLTYDNLRGGHLTYYRRKTGGRLDIRWEQQMQIPISVISDALGHDSEKTTLIYLSTLDTSAVDNANSEILAALGEW